MSVRIRGVDQNLDPNLAGANLDREDRGVIRPQVKGATALEVEAGMMPMTGQDAVLDAAALERKAHVRAPIVEGKNAPAVEDDENRTMGSVHNEPALRFQVIKSAYKSKLLTRRVHGQTSLD
jgi:hypothetical protein